MGHLLQQPQETNTFLKNSLSELMRKCLQKYFNSCTFFFLSNKVITQLISILEDNLYHQ